MTYTMNDNAYWGMLPSLTDVYKRQQGGYIYEPAVGNLKIDIAPKITFEDIPEHWVCPVSYTHLKKATELGIPVVITPGANNRSVAEHAVAMKIGRAHV